MGEGENTFVKAIEAVDDRQVWKVRMQLIVNDPAAGLRDHVVQASTIDIPPVPEYNYPEMFKILKTLVAFVPLPTRGVPFEPIPSDDPAKLARSEFVAGMLESLRQFKEYALRYNDSLQKEVIELVDGP